MTQNEIIREHLESGLSLTPIDALNQFGCFRLASRINDLRKEGMEIETVMKYRNKKRYASYKLSDDG